ncbi:arabinogalactan oligomer/maltooligosaccharide transport system permease protein [Paenibacillus anaericanus]|uniref:carbohydrate ABC transporter permease n=1 Tax=Paenibacillus anaericanus TaxID=170367 RepID=UPI00278B7857|nr:sugar ABC transporter permease [Paenibacillus anaericanus]MDQ0089575.1 arabinogalactan oligomer/maltooligosaccharide transport system permease protein [Paenibacillus anaericanus]
MKLLITPDDREISSNKLKISLFLSLLFMGLGQLYNRQFAKGILLFLLEVYVLIFWSKPIGKGIWGLITLGDQLQVRQRGRVLEQGDHSIFLMVEGIIYLLAILLLICFYIFNIGDAYKVRRGILSGIPVHDIRHSLKNAWERGYVYFLLAPAIIFTMFLTILPLLFGILIAFTNYSGPNHLPPKHLVDWIGLKTFSNLFNLRNWSHTFLGVVKWTLLWALLATITTYFTGLFYALIINVKAVKFKRMWRTVYILPWAIPAFVSILIFRNFFNAEFGPLNEYLGMLGIEKIPWLSNPHWAKVSLVFVNTWLGFPFWLALMSGVLTNIDKDMYEAAEIDGASPWQRFSTITFPLVLFATAPLLIMSFANNLNNFNIIYLFTEGGPVNMDYSFAGSTDILISWIFKLTLQQNQFNTASAISILIFIIIAVFSIWNFRQTRAFKEEDMIQ